MAKVNLNKIRFGDALQELVNDAARSARGIFERDDANVGLFIVAVATAHADAHPAIRCAAIVKASDETGHQLHAAAAAGISIAGEAEIEEAIRESPEHAEALAAVFAYARHQLLRELFRGEVWQTRECITLDLPGTPPPTQEPDDGQDT